MNPAILAATLVALTSLGVVSSAYIASQQAINNAYVQKTTQERDRLAEQVNAYISAVTPSGSNATVATVKNTGTSAVTIDHCLVLSWPSGGSTLPSATKPSTVSGTIINPGSTFDITIAGTVSGDNIKCVTSKGTILPVKIGAASSSADASPDPNDYISIYGVTASVSMAQSVYKHNLRNQPWGSPLPPQQPSGSLTYNVPVLKPVTVNYIARIAPDNSVDAVMQDGSSMHYNAGQKIPVPIRGPANKITIKFTPDDAPSRRLEIDVRPLLVSNIVSVAGNSGVAARSDSDYYTEGGYPNCWYGNNRGIGIYAGIGGNRNLFGSSLISAGTTCTVSGSSSNYYYIGSTTYFGYSTAEIVNTYSFPAPKDTITVEVPYSISYWGCGYCTNTASTIYTTLYLDPGDGNFRTIVTLNNDFYYPSRGNNPSCTDGSCVGYVSPTSPTLPSFKYTLSNLVPGQTVNIAIRYRADTYVRQDSQSRERFDMSTTVNIY